MQKSVMASALLVLLGASGCATDTSVTVPESESHYSVRDYVADGVFTQGIEGPAVGLDGNLYAVNFEREGTIGRVQPQADGTGKATLFIELPKGSTGNGIRFDQAGNMYIADYTGHHILRANMQTKEVSVFAHNDAMHQPNDIAITTSGVLYASDPSWATATGQLWRIDRDGSTHLLEANMGTTNGITVSPNQQQLYVNESVQRRVWVYDILASGELDNKRLLIEFADHGLDGMRCDAQGNLYIARYGAGVVVVVSAEGKLLRDIKLKGQKPTNVAFGGTAGKQVFVTLQDRGAIETFTIP